MLLNIDKLRGQTSRHQPNGEFRMEKDVSIYIGRFSPFHKGHAYVLEQALRTSKLTIVLIGSSGQSRSLKNPFSFQERKEMIEAWYSKTCVKAPPGGMGQLRIVALRDHPYNDALWIRSVQRLVKKTATDFAYMIGSNGDPAILTDFHVVGSDRDDSTWYLNAFPQWKKDLAPPHRINGETNISATEIRKMMFSSAGSYLTERDVIGDYVPPTTLDFLDRFCGAFDYEQSSSEWIDAQLEKYSDSYSQLVREYEFIERYKASWSRAPYAPTFVTVDSVIVQSGHILVVKRGAEPGKGLWALPGGFLDQNERLLDGAIREVIEETGLSLAQGKNADKITREILKGSMRDKEIFDAPDRSARGRTITTAFLFRLDDTKPLPKVKGSDDAAAAFWLPIDRALEETHMFFEDHAHIITALIGKKDL